MLLLAQYSAPRHAVEMDWNQRVARNCRGQRVRYILCRDALRNRPVGLGAGLLGLVMPEVLGSSYGWAQFSIGLDLLTLPLWVILLMPFAKMLATSLSIGSGGSGGIFGPGIVVGGMAGALFWRSLRLACPISSQVSKLSIPASRTRTQNLRLSRLSVPFRPRNKWLKRNYLQSTALS